MGSYRFRFDSEISWAVQSMSGDLECSPNRQLAMITDQFEASLEPTSLLIVTPSR
jgi:hypothetical protein